MTSGLSLQRVDDTTGAVDELAAAWGGRVGLDAVLGDLPRTLRHRWAPGSLVRDAWRFDLRDQLDLRWWPQGVSTYADAGRADGRRLAMATWYAKRLPRDPVNHGSRLTVLDLDAGRYRHVLLVKPTGDGRVESLKVHAGGLVWQDDRVHVAATGRGFYTCRLDDVVRAPSRGAAFGYRYVLPVSWLYRSHAAEEVEKFRYSFLSRDHTDGSLLAGEYTNNPARTRRIARFALPPGADRAELELLGDGPRRMQGVAITNDGRLHASVSQGRFTLGSLYSGAAGALRHHPRAVPMGNEDLAHTPDDDRLWTVSEHPFVRWLVALDAP